MKKAAVGPVAELAVLVSVAPLEAAHLEATVVRLDKSAVALDQDVPVVAVTLDPDNLAIHPRSPEVDPVTLGQADHETEATLDQDAAGPESEARFRVEAGLEELQTPEVAEDLDLAFPVDPVDLDQVAAAGRVILDQAVGAGRADLDQVFRVQKEPHCNTKLKRELMP